MAQQHFEHIDVDVSIYVQCTIMSRNFDFGAPYTFYIQKAKPCTLDFQIYSYED